MEKSLQIKAIIFDMDGLMFDTERLYSRALAQIAENMGYREEITDSFILSIKGKKKEDIEKIYKSLLDQKSIERTGKEFDFEEYMKQTLSLIDDIIQKEGLKIKPGLLELIEFAKENNIKLAIGSSDKYNSILTHLKQTNISEDTFDTIVSGDMVKNGKPAPDIFLTACQKIGVSPQESIVLEDSPNGLRAAHNANSNPIMVVDCIQPTEEIKKLLFVEPLSSLHEVKDLLIKLK